MKLPLLSAKEICKFLEKLGFVSIRQKGSHRFYEHPSGRSTVVPIHPGKDVGRGLPQTLKTPIISEFRRICTTNKANEF